MKNFVLFLLTIATITAKAQSRSISGSVRDRQTTEALQYSNVQLLGTTIGATTDNNGYFKLEIPKAHENGKLIATYLGYRADTIQLTATKTIYKFNLNVSAGTMKEVVVSGTMKETSKLDSPIPVEVYNPVFFKKNPTPNIFEALTMVNGVQPQLNCNVCSTGDIHINGMEGPYTMVLIDGMPIVSSLSTVYGLAGIPNSMVKRIEIVKGPASALYGSEAVGGLINIITKDPVTAPVLKVDIAGTTWNEYNADVTAKFKVKKTSSLLGINGFYFNTIHDINNDGFTDVTLQKRISIFNKWNFERKSGKPVSIAARYIYENRWGGQTTWTPEFRGTDSIYGESIYTNRAEVIGVYGLPVKHQNIRVEYSYNYHYQDSYYGTIKYKASQHTAFSQLLWDKTIGNHSLLFGVPFRFISYDDNSPATATTDTLNPKNKPQLTILPGLFVQDEWTINKKLTTLVGMRYDHNNEHGNIFTPRLSFKFRPNNNHTIRLSGGNGYRVVNLFTEDHAALTGAREVVIAEKLKPEQSWNVNLNYVTQIDHKNGFIGIDMSTFYTYFTNKIVGDFNTDPDKIIYDNLNGYAISKGATLNLDFAFTNGLKIILGGTLMDVYQIESDSVGVNVKRPQQFAPKFSSTFAASYTLSKLGLSFDLTGLVKSPMYLPVLPNDFRPEQSPWFCLMNLQATKKAGNDIEFYGGVKNILNFVPKNPIMRPHDPFDKDLTVNNPNGYTFDPSYNYAAVQGARIFFGVRWTLQ
ncbi:MAG: TonB-dependent receptor [Bacteroidetes bacterium]|nr:TonB-dependent receptor [Bacteroidota bacterium]